jgi:hypothetical protein
MFPEGTTTNGTSIVKFRSGAFVAGVPVVPTVFKYSFTFFDPAFSSVSLKWHLLGTLSQLINFMEVEYMPVYYPSEEERRCGGGSKECADHDLVLFFLTTPFTRHFAHLVRRTRSCTRQM